MLGHTVGPVRNYPVDTLVTRPGARFVRCREAFRGGSPYDSSASPFVLSSVSRECPQGPEDRFAGHGVLLCASGASAAGLEPASCRSSELVELGVEPLENCIASTSIFVLPSYKEPTVDALASTTDEGRVWLRKATVSCLESVTNRGCPNGETHHLCGWYSRVNT